MSTLYAVEATHTVSIPMLLRAQQLVSVVLEEKVAGPRRGEPCSTIRLQAGRA